jgi:hypothetical protein
MIHFKKSLVLLPILSFGCDTGTEVKIGTTNSPPSVTILSPGDGESFDEDSIIHFQAIVSDSYDAPSDLTILWSTDLQGDLNSIALPDSQGNIMFSTANLEVGSHVVTLTAWDSDESQSQASLQLEIIDLPEDPTIEVLRPTNDDTTIEAVPFSLMVQVWDARDELDTLPVNMLSDVDGEICNTAPSSTGLAECDALLTAGSHLLTFAVSNSSGYEAYATAYFDVISVLDIDDDGDGFTENQGDCDDNDPTLAPGQPEVANGLDDNCNDTIDEGTVSYDDDGDCFCEHTPCHGSINPSCSTLSDGDCDDTNAGITPVAVEICGNAIDDNCNNTQDELNAVDCTTYYRDSDVDGYGDPNLSECWCQPGGTTGEFTSGNNQDCFDGNSDANPAQTGYFTSDRNDGSFDYNCDGSQEQSLLNVGSCDGWLSNIGDCTMNTAGWESGVPACGQSAPYIVDNDSCSAGCEFFGVPFCCEATPSSSTQSCR